MDNFFLQIFKNPNTHKLFYNLGTRYQSYFKYSFCIGTGIGFILTGAKMLDLKDEKYKFSRVEKLSYPLFGGLAGGVIGVTFPIWIFFVPLTYVFGYTATSEFAKIALIYSLGLHSIEDNKDGKDEKKEN
jgi:hypothetical protein